MPIKVFPAKLTGNPDVSGWCQIDEFKSIDEDELVKKGHFFSLFAKKSSDDPGFSLAQGREVLLNLKNSYFESVKGPYDALKEAVEKTGKELESASEVEFCALTVVNRYLYFVAWGAAKLAIYRDGVYGKILDGQKGSLLSSSGGILEKDVFIVGTSTFFDFFTQGQIQAALDAGGLGAIEFLAPSIHTKLGTGNVGALVLDFTKQEALKPAFGWTPVLAKRVFGQKENIHVKDTDASLLARVRSFSKMKVRGSDTSLLGQKKKVSASVGIILLIMLLVSIFFGIKQKRENEKRESYEGRLAQAEHNLDEAVKLFSLDETRARELFVESKTILDELTSQGITGEKIENLRKNLLEKEGEILGEFKIEPELFLDLSLLSNGFKGDSLSYSGGQAFILDKKGKRVVSITLDTKRTEVVAGPNQISEVDGFTSYSGRVFVVNSDGIFEPQVGEIIINKDWEGEVVISAYAGNMYVVDERASKILRYQAGESGFGSKQDWLAAGTTLASNNIDTILIDGSVWLFQENEGISKYNQGVRQPFSLKGVFPETTDLRAIFTSEDVEYVYLLDTANSRIVVVTKSGDFKAQYLSEQIKFANGLVVTEANSKIILLMENKLYSIEIKHF